MSLPDTSIRSSLLDIYEAISDFVPLAMPVAPVYSLHWLNWQTLEYLGLNVLLFYEPRFLMIISSCMIFKIIHTLIRKIDLCVCKLILNSNLQLYYYTISIIKGLIIFPKHGYSLVNTSSSSVHFKMQSQGFFLPRPINAVICTSR